MVIASVVFLWAACWVSSTSCTLRDIDSELLESETGWQLDDEEIEVFDAPAPAPAAAAPAPKPSGNTVALINGDFESTNLTGNASFTLADQTSTAIINWQPGGAGVQILNGNTYQMSSFKKGIYAIHLNNPASTVNGTQGSLSTTLAINPPTGKSFTVQFDCARCPDAPINVFTAMKISSIATTGGTINSWEIRRAPYNSTDTQKQITYVRYSFGYTGTGVATQLKFESMSEKYGCIFDNVVILNGNHALAAAPGSAKVILWQKIFPVFSVLALLTVTTASPSSILSAL
jgi:hypothetical protein